MLIVPALASIQALVPLAVVGLVRARRPVDESWVWIAFAFAVSFAADVAQLQLPRADRWLISIVYPISQAGLIVAVLLPRREIVLTLGVFVLVGAASVVWRGVSGPDVALRTVTWLTVIGLVWDRWELPAYVRPALLIHFGVGWFAWLAFAVWGASDPLYRPWYAMQAVRLAGLSVFSYAVWRSSPRLKLISFARAA